LAAVGGNVLAVTGKEAIRMNTELLTARVKLSLARMYLSDLRNGVDFGRMVDGRGAGFNCNASLWRERIQRIASEIAALLPDEAASLTGEGARL
jgi:hypothetical protein